MRRTLLVLLGIAAAGCSDDLLEVPTADRMLLSPLEIHLADGEHGALTFTLQTDDGTLILPSATTWESRDPAIVAVDTAGRLTAQGEGTTYVVVRSAGVGDSAAVVVQRDWLAVPNSGNWCRLQGNGLLQCPGLLRATPAGATAVWGLGATSTQCIIVSGGVIQCRGSNYAGALGDGSPMDTSSTNVTRDAFAPVSGPAGYEQIVGYLGLAFCGRRSAEVRCWGYDNSGSVGNDTSRANVGIPTPVAGGLTFTSLAEELDSPEMCGTSGGQLWCWGGFSNAPASRIPHAVTSDYGLVRASRGYDHTCALDAEGSAWCWGYNNDGQLGRGVYGPDWVFDSIPAQVVTDVRFADILAYGNFSCGVSLTGEIWCWGTGRAGQLGTAGVSRSSVPIKLQSQEQFVAIHQGYSSSACALTVGGAEYCWGGLSPNLDTKPEEYLPRRTPTPF